jgi:tetratricopeptide (TPR) repeat protein
MGGKQSGRGKHIYLCAAILILLSPAACALNKMMTTTMVDITGEEALAHLAKGRIFLSQGDYRNALKENERVLSLAGRNTPLDEALFYVGLIHALPANPARNFGKSVIAFKRLIKEYPGSSWIEQAKGMVDLLQENDNLSRRVDRLNNIIDELKKVDIGVDQKKRDR